MQNGNWDKIWTKIFEEPTNSFTKAYKKIFSIDEIENNTVLKWFGGSLLVVILVTFVSWFSNHSYTKEAVAVNLHTCWAYFQDCGKLAFLSAFPHGSSLNIFYTAMLAILFLAVICIARKNWLYAHMLMMLLFLWHFLMVFVLSRNFNANYWYISTTMLLVFLFFPHKHFFLRLTLVVFYFLAGTVKLDTGWILGTYFTSLSFGLPIFPDILAPVMTNFVIIMELVGAWFLLGRNKHLYHFALTFFILFHLYSVILVEYMYPLLMLSVLMILFGPMNKVIKTPLDKKAIFGFAFILMMLIFQSISFIIPGDEKYTLEGNFYGMYMFEANHQCVGKGAAYDTNGEVVTNVHVENVLARGRCDPYNMWFSMQGLCKNPDVEKVVIDFDHSINGGPFYRLINNVDMCNVEYKPFSHNEWITLPEEAELVGYPVENFYSDMPILNNFEPKTYDDNTIVLRGLNGQERTSLNSLQKAILPLAEEIRILYFMILGFVLVFLASRFLIAPLFKDLR